MNLIKFIKKLFRGKDDLTEETRCLVFNDGLPTVVKENTVTKIKTVSKNNPQVSVLDEHETAVALAEILQQWINEGKMKSYKHALSFIRKWNSLGLVSKYDSDEEFVKYEFRANDDVMQLSKSFRFLHYKTPNESNKLIDWMRKLSE